MLIEKVFAVINPTDLDKPIKTSGFFKFTNIGQLITRLLPVALSISAVIALLFIIWGAIDLIFSQGDKQHYEGSRNKITYALIGLAITAAVWAMWIIILKFAGFGSFGSEVKLEIKP